MTTTKGGQPSLSEKYGGEETLRTNVTLTISQRDHLAAMGGVAASIRTLVDVDMGKEPLKVAVDSIPIDDLYELVETYQLATEHNLDIRQLVKVAIEQTNP